MRIRGQDNRASNRNEGLPDTEQQNSPIVNRLGGQTGWKKRTRSSRLADYTGGLVRGSRTRGQLPLGCEPVVQVATMSAAARHKDFISAEPDLLEARRCTGFCIRGSQRAVG